MTCSNVSSVEIHNVKLHMMNTGKWIQNMEHIFACVRHLLGRKDIKAILENELNFLPIFLKILQNLYLCQIFLKHIYGKSAKHTKWTVFTNYALPITVTVVTSLVVQTVTTSYSVDHVTPIRLCCNEGRAGSRLNLAHRDSNVMLQADALAMKSCVCSRIFSCSILNPQS